MSARPHREGRSAWRAWLLLLFVLFLLAAWAPLLANAQPLVAFGGPNGGIDSPALRSATRADLLWFLAGLFGLGGILVFWRRPGSARGPALGLFVLAVVALAAALFREPENLARPDAEALRDGTTRWWAPIRHGWRDIEPEASRRLLSPGEEGGHPLGTDRYGRDVAARLIFGTRASLLVGFTSVMIATLLGALLGGLAGYLGRWADGLVSFAIQVMICFPVLFLVLALQTVLPPSLLWLIVLLGLTRWPRVAQMTRAEVMRLRRRDFVIAAQGQAMGTLRILSRHLIPNALGPIVVTAAFGVGGAILLESALSFLGLGVPAPLASWGEMLQQGRQSLPRGGHLIFLPGLLLFLTIAACHRLGDALREALDPRLGRETAS